MNEIGAYQLLEPLGHGGLGDAFRARDTVHGRTVVVKRVPPDLAADAAWLSRFRDSCAAVASHVDTREIGRWFLEHRSGAADHSYALWAVWVLERWLQRARRTSESPLAVSTG